MRVVEIRKEEELAGLRDAWTRLLEESPATSIFLTWEWLSAWWTAYGVPGDLRILLAYDEEGRLRGAAPLRWRTASRFKQTYRMLAFVGDGSADSDYLDFPIAAGDERAVMEAFAKYLEPDLTRGVLLELNEIPESSPNMAILREWMARGNMVSVEADSPCAAVVLPGDWQAYLKQLPSRFRTKVRSVLRSFEDRSEFQFRFLERGGELDSWLPALFELHRRRWARESKPGVFGWDKKQIFYRALSPLLLERGRLCFSALEWNGRILACQYGFSYRNEYSQLQEGYEPECEHLNAGVALRAWTIQRFIERGYTKYDFLGGVGRHKSDWGSETLLSKRMTLGRNTAANALYCRGPEWMAGTRQTIKQLAPESWLAARDARQETQRVAAFQNGHGASAGDAEWKRNFLAGCYYYSPLPKLLRPWRDRYSLNGKLLKPRKTPTARIVYYHHVCDEQDPFFPATPVEIFEQEMRIVAKNYRVVSLDEAVRRLTEGGPPEPVVVITFDDGYLDNYEIAFPILQRYGLTATIFLTTGAVDTGEPLWFDRLSLAVKKSPHQHVDLELDLPRRFWLRNDGEKLRSRDQLYTYFRGLPEADKRDRLQDVIARLGGKDEGERNGRMLSWDQIRLLRKQGIGFGGHTVTHPFVSRLSQSDACWEAGECKRRIEEELQAPVEHFAYPSGRDMDFSPWNKEVVKSAGYKSAVSTIWGINDPATDPLELRRGQPWETNPACFAAKFDWYQWVNG